MKDHTALFDLYVTVGRDIDYLSSNFGIDPDDLINRREGYGEKLRVTAADVAANPKLAAAIMEDRDTAKAIEEFGMALDYSGKGRLKKLSRLLIEEYVERFYPGIASEHPENDWICIEAYLDQMHPGWKAQVDVRPAGDDGAEGKVTGKVRSSKPKRKVRNNFRLY